MFKCFQFNSRTVLVYLFHLQPKVVTDLDEAELEKKLNQLELENQEVAGDDDEEDEAEDSKPGNGEAASEDEENEKPNTDKE